MFLVTLFVSIVAVGGYDASGEYGRDASLGCWGTSYVPPPLIYQFWRAHAKSKAEYLHHCDMVLGPLGVDGIVLPTCTDLTNIELRARKSHEDCSLAHMIISVLGESAVASVIGRHGWSTHLVVRGGRLTLSRQRRIRREIKFLGPSFVFAQAEMSSIHTFCRVRQIYLLDMYFDYNAERHCLYRG